MSEPGLHPTQTTPNDLRNAQLSPVQHGVDEAQVRRLLNAAAADLELCAADRERLRQEVERAGSAPGRSHVDIAAETVNLLSQAQMIADRTIAEAEQYSRDLVETARNQYHEILRRAEDSSSTSSDGAGSGGGSAADSGEIEYVRTYARVAAIQLRSVIDALAEQVDKLGHLPDPALDTGDRPSAQNPHIEGVSWLPAAR